MSTGFTLVPPDSRQDAALRYGSLSCLKICRSRANPLPEFFLAKAGLGRKSNDRDAAIGSSQRVHCLPHLVARQPVTLGGDDYMRTPFGCQKFQQLRVAFLWRNVRIDQRQTQRQTRPLVKIGIDKAC